MTKKKGKRHNREWSENDMLVMRAGAKIKMSAREVAGKLGRSTGAVKYKAMVLGIRFRNINQPKGAQKKAQATLKAKARKRVAAAKKGAATRRAKIAEIQACSA